VLKGAFLFITTSFESLFSIIKMGFKIIIVGGSVTGLSLANMLERFNIEYVLLEAYPQIAPQVGASIGLLPNGNRILDQIGCFEPVLSLMGDYSGAKMYIRGPDGKMKWRSAELDVSYHVQQRLGRLSFPSSTPFN
jgi:2-polyprenyl-6-methoxyphenol hydroxylase-like FAD-dependent oxidoreductase